MKIIERIERNIKKLEKIYTEHFDVLPGDALILIAEKITRLQETLRHKKIEIELEEKVGKSDG